MNEVFEFTAIPREEIKENNVFTLLESGNYPFEVTSAISKFSQAGNPMLEVHLIVNGTNVIRDWLVIQDKMLWKLVHFSDSIGLGKEFDKGKMPLKEIFGKKGFLELEIVPDNRNPEVMQNKVKDYIVTEIKVAKEEIPVFNDDIPF